MTSVSDEKWRPFNCLFQSGRAKDLSAPQQMGVERRETHLPPLALTCHSKKNSEGCPPKQGFPAAMTSVSDEKWRPFNCLFQSGQTKYLSAPQQMGVERRETHLPPPVFEPRSVQAEGKYIKMTMLTRSTNLVSYVCEMSTTQYARHFTSALQLTYLDSITY
jgi:hypothetical protein